MNMKNLPQDSQLAFPILLLPIGEVSKELDSLLESISMDPVDITCPAIDEIKSVAQRYGIDPPRMARVLPFYTRNITEHYSLARRFKQENTNYYLSYYSTIVFVDAAVNKDVGKMLDELKLPYDTNYRVESVFRATEELVSMHSDTRFLLFDTFAEDVCISTIQYFLQNVVSVSMISFISSLENALNPLKATKIKAEIYGISSYIDGIEPLMKGIQADLESSSQSSLWLATFFELLGYLDVRFPGTPRILKMIPSGPTQSSPFPSYCQLKNPPDSVSMFDRAAAFYKEAKMYSKVVDCGVKILGLDCTAIASNIISIISKNNIEVEIAWDFLHMMCRFSLPRKTALAAFQFADLPGYAKYQNELREFGLGLLMPFCTSPKSFFTVRELFIPCLDKILDSYVPETFITNTVIPMMATVGYLLPGNQQNKIFGKIFSVNQPIKCSLPISITNARIVYDEAEIRGTDTNGTSVFIYRNQVNQKKSSIILVANRTYQLSATVMNPFDFDIGVSSFNNNTCHSTLKHKCETEVTSTISFSEPGEYKITGFPVTLSTVELLLDYQMSFKVVESAPSVRFKTDLQPEKTLEFIDGETFKFNVWIENLGDDPIKSLKIRTMEKFVSRDNVEGRIHIPIATQVVHGMTVIIVQATAYIQDSNNYSFVEIKQPITVRPGLMVSRVFKLATLSSDDGITLGCEIINKCSDAFQISAYDTNSDIEEKRIIGPRESLIITRVVPENDIDIEGMTPDPKRLSLVSQQMEMKLERRLTKEDRSKCGKTACLLQRLEGAITITWHYSASRSGVLLLNGAGIDEQLLNSLELHQNIMSYSWSSNKASDILELTVEFKEEMELCELDLGRLIDVVIWQGVLRYAQRSTRYIFRLSFEDSSSYQFRCLYRNKSGIMGSNNIKITTI